MHCEDWRLASPDELLPWLDAERSRWLDQLGWDIAAGLEAAERGRQSGRTPGLVARDDTGGVAGWTFYWTDRGTLHLGVLAGARAEAVRLLLDEAIEAPEATYARRYQAFLFPASPAVASALARRRFLLAPQLLLSRMPPGPAPVDEVPGCRPWRMDDLPNAVRLLARAYAGSPTGQAFAPDGRLDEWVAYLAQVVRSSACGPLQPTASFVVEGERPDRPAATVLTTATAADTWHIAQIAVDPLLQGRGLARGLVRRVLGQAAIAGMRAVTLVVDERNAAARALYASLGFVPRATLLLASRPRLTRVTSSGLTEARVPSA